MELTGRRVINMERCGVLTLASFLHHRRLLWNKKTPRLRFQIFHDIAICCLENLKVFIVLLEILLSLEEFYLGLLRVHPCRKIRESSTYWIRVKIVHHKVDFPSTLINQLRIENSDWICESAASLDPISLENSRGRKKHDLIPVAKGTCQCGIIKNVKLNQFFYWPRSCSCLDLRSKISMKTRDFHKRANGKEAEKRSIATSSFHYYPKSIFTRYWKN